MIRQLHITVEVDPALADGLHDEFCSKLARGLRVSTCYGGVRVDGLPGMTRHGAPIFVTCSDAILKLHTLADIQAEFAERVGLVNTATGLYMLDRAVFLRLAARELLKRRRMLWPAS